MNALCGTRVTDRRPARPRAYAVTVQPFVSEAIMGWVTLGVTVDLVRATGRRRRSPPQTDTSMSLPLRA